MGKVGEAKGKQYEITWVYRYEKDDSDIDGTAGSSEISKAEDMDMASSVIDSSISE